MNGVNKTEHTPAANNLHITDSRTMRDYTIPIINNAVQAIDFKQISTSTSTASQNVSVGLRIFDPGLQNTAVMESAVTLVDGKRGLIEYRNHPIERLFHDHTYEEVVYLLIWGHLPDVQQAEAFRQKLAKGTYVPDLVVDVIKTFPPNSPPSTLLQAGLSAWAASNPIIVPTHAGKNVFHAKADVLDDAIINTISALVVIVAQVYCHQNSRAFSPPSAENTLIENFLLMIGHVDPSTGKPRPDHVNFVNRLWILYADHELSNSTAAFLLVGSTLADPISCAVASVCSAYGPLHGGAVEMAYHAFERIGRRENVPQVIADAKAGKGRLYGFGHRIYETVDPRVALVRELMGELESEHPLLAIAMEVDRLASADEFFISRKLSPNADLYGCLVCSALGFPVSISLATLCAARLPGVLAHWREAMNRPPRLWRPQQIFVGGEGINISGT